MDIWKEQPVDDGCNNFPSQASWHSTWCNCCFLGFHAGKKALKRKKSVDGTCEEKANAWWEGERGNLPAIEGREIGDVPDAGCLAYLQESGDPEIDERRTPGEQAVLEIGWRIVAARDRGDARVKMMAHGGQPADHRHPEILQTQPQGNAQLRVLRTPWATLFSPRLSLPFSHFSLALALICTKFREPALEGISRRIAWRVPSFRRREFNAKRTKAWTSYRGQPECKMNGEVYNTTKCWSPCNGVNTLVIWKSLFPYSCGRVWNRMIQSDLPWFRMS